MSFLYRKRSRSGVVDGFEDNDIAEYGGQTGSATVQGTTVKEGSYALQLDNVSGQDDRIVSTTGLDMYPQPGDRFETWFRFTTAGDDYLQFNWACQAETLNPERYVAVYTDNGQKVQLGHSTGTFTTTVLAETALDLAVDTWYRFQVQWIEDGTMILGVYDAAGSKLAEISAVDTTLSSGGIGFQCETGSGNASTSYYDGCAITGGA